MSTERRSVLLVHHADLRSPVGCTVPHYLVRELSKSHTVHVLCRQRSGGETGSLPDGVQAYTVDTGEVPILSGLLFVFLSAASALVLGVTYQYDAVYAFQHELLQGWLGALAGRGRFVVGLQSVPVRQYRDFRNARDDQRETLRRYVTATLLGGYAAVTRHLLGRASAITCLTEEIRRVTEDVYDLDLSGAHVVGMGVDIERFRRDDHEQPDTSRWVVTYVGAVSALRGLDDVIEAIAATEADIELRIAGDGTDTQVASLKRLARAHGVTDRIQWLGLLPHERIPQLLETTDIAVSPLPEIESYRISFPAKVLEYMAAGCVVVATDLPAHRRVIDHGENGFLYQGGQDGLANAIETCIEQADRHDAIGNAAMETAAEYSWDRIVTQHERAMFG